MRETDDFKRGIEIATTFIAYRMRSEFEVARRLNRAELEPTVVSRVIAHLKDVMLLDDGAFAEAYARDQMIGRKRGPVRVRAGLSALGVEKAVAESAIKRVNEEFEVDTYEQAVELAAKRWGSIEDKVGPRLRAKRVYEYLVRRGYPFGEARAAVDEVRRQHGTTGQSA
jgi:regulatory protein